MIINDNNMEPMGETKNTIKLPGINVTTRVCPEMVPTKVTSEKCVRFLAFPNSLDKGNSTLIDGRKWTRINA